MKTFFTSNQLNKFSTFWFRVSFLCSIVLVIFSNTGLSQTWSEDWEGNWTTDWHVDAGTWEVGTPTSGPNGAYNGQKCAATVLAGNYPANASTRLIRHTSFVVPSADQNPRLRFWHWYSIYPGDQATVQIKLGGGDWQTISEVYNYSGSGVWTYPSIDLSAYSDSTVQIAFYFVSDVWNSSTGWYIDDVAIITGQIEYINPEHWEMGLGDWYVDRGTWEVGEPTSGPSSAYSGQNCAATVLGGNYFANVSSRLISPSFILPGITSNPSLTFWHWYNIYSDDQATVQIKVGDGDWQTVLGPYTNTSGGIWSPTFVDLSQFADSTVQIAFYFVSDVWNSSTGWYIDEINILPYIVNNVDVLNDNVPSQFQLLQNYPNPFNPSTKIKYSIPEIGFVTLIVYDLLGNEIVTLVNQEKQAGSYEVEFSAFGGASQLSSGIYFYKLRAGSFVDTKKMILLK